MEKDSDRNRLAEVEAIVARDALDAMTPGAGARLVELSREIALYGAHRDDPVRTTLGRVGDRWSCLVLLILFIAPFRHATLQRLLNALDSHGISPRMLSISLRSLERDGLISRTVIPASPVKVEYALTDMGRELASHIDIFTRWAVSKDRQIQSARLSFDERGGEDGHYT